MFKGGYLTLMIGPGAPVPAPQVVINSLESVQVNSSTERTGFQLTFNVGKNSVLQTTMLPAGYFDPMITRVIVMVTVKGIPEVLADGMITNQELSPSDEPGQSKLTVTGEDLSILMDVVEMPFMRLPPAPDNVKVMTILAKYAAFGIIPAAMPPIIPDVSPPTSKIYTQEGTDLQYIRQLARGNGYVFYVEPGPAPLSNIAYWGPDVRVPQPQSALNVNMDAHTNVESLSFSLDGLKKKIVVMTVYDPATRKVPVPIPLPNFNAFRPPLGARPTVPSKVEFPEGMAALSPTRAAAEALGILFTSADAITVSGSLDVVRYGRVLKSRRLVGVRGAGLAYDGFYYVNSVNHDIQRGSYKQNFNLSRDGLISNTPKVVP